MKICYFGIYDKEYSRNRIIIRGLKENGHKVVECNVNPKENKGIKKYIKLIQEYSRIKLENNDSNVVKSFDDKFDLVIVGFPGHSVVFLAKILFKTVVFDAFLSLYDSNVYDRQIYKKNSFGALKDYLLDFYSVYLSDKVLIDTKAHVDYFQKTFFADPRKFIIVPISSDDGIFHPIEKPIIKKLIHFHGMFIPLQGINNILETAKIMPDYHFRFLGQGQLFLKMKEKVEKEKIKNVEFLGKIDFAKVPEYIAESEICLGIFGETEKTQRVIPNKVYEYVSMGKKIVTLDTPAIREVFSDKDMILSKSSKPEDIKEAILKAEKTTEFTCLQTYNQKLKPKIITEKMIKEIKQF